jgi:hypothetical protein
MIEPTPAPPTAATPTAARAIPAARAKATHTAAPWWKQLLATPALAIAALVNRLFRTNQPRPVETDQP